MLINFFRKKKHKPDAREQAYIALKKEYTYIFHEYDDREDTGFFLFTNCSQKAREMSERGTKYILIPKED